MTKKAISYLRKSTDRKDRQRFSLETQEKEIQKARLVAEAFFNESVEIVETYIEKISWTDRNRPEFTKMRDKFDNQEAEILLSWRLDRLSRNPVDSGEIMQAMQDRVIPYVADSTRVYTRKDSWLLMGVLFGQASQESMEISDKSMRGTETLIENGWVPYKVPFWAKNNIATGVALSERVKIDPVESHFAKKMFELRADGMSYKDIASWLHGNGFKSKNGTKYAPSVIENWIKNKFYYGVCEWGGHTWRHIYEPIIEKELWESANSVGRWNTPRLPKDLFPLKGIVLSKETGNPLTASIAKKKYPQYHTHARIREEWDKVSISEARILELFENEIKFYVVPEKIKPYIIEALRDTHKTRLKQLNTERLYLSGEITQNSNKIDGLIDLRVNWELTAEQFKIKQKEYMVKAVELEEKIKKIIVEDDTLLTAINDSVELLNNLGQYWKNADNEKKNQIIKMIVVELFVDEKKTLYIKENAVFEALRELNYIEWLPIRLNGRTDSVQESVLLRFAINLIENKKIVKNIYATLSKKL